MTKLLGLLKLIRGEHVCAADFVFAYKLQHYFSNSKRDRNLLFYSFPDSES